MTTGIEQKEASLTDPYLIIEDPYERLQAVLDSVHSPLPYPAADQTDAWRVKGCVTPVWLKPFASQGHCRFPLESTSITVRGLAALVCQLYDQELASTVAAYEHTLFERLRLANLISTSRQNGLAALRTAIRQFAQAQLPQPADRLNL